jgi:hypothetical protein
MNIEDWDRNREWRSEEIVMGMGMGMGIKIKIKIKIKIEDKN